MTRFGCTVVCLSLVASANGGCLLFSDPINRAPTVSITCSQNGAAIPCSPDQDPPPEFVRNKIVFQAVASDPDQAADTLRFDWATDKNCSNAAAGLPAFPKVGFTSFPFTPTDLIPGCVAVVVTDTQGASASAQQAFTVVDQAPTAKIEIVPGPGLVLPEIGQPFLLPLYAKATLTGKDSTDPDDNPTQGDFFWNVRLGDTLISMPGCPDPNKEPYLCTFTTATPGTYFVQLVVSDGVLKSEPTAQTIQVAGDQLPSIVLDLVQPTPPLSPDDPPLQLLASLDNTFTINRVDDDGDPYPSADPATPYLTPPAGFVWFIQTGSDVSSFKRLTGANGPSYTIHPGPFHPQDSIRLRVEYHDRVTACQPDSPGCDAAFRACDRSAAICYSPDLRAQWVTWAVVFR